MLDYKYNKKHGFGNGHIDKIRRKLLNGQHLIVPRIKINDSDEVTSGIETYIAITQIYRDDESMAKQLFDRLSDVPGFVETKADAKKAAGAKVVNVTNIVTEDKVDTPTKPEAGKKPKRIYRKRKTKAKE